MGHVAGQEAAAGIRDAQRAVHEDLEFHVGAFLPDLGNFLQRQFAGQDDPGEPELLPELHARIVDDVRLHRQVNRHVRESLAHHHDEPRVGHDERVGAHIDNRRQVFEIGFQLVVVRRDVTREKELSPGCVCFLDALPQHGVLAEFVVTHAQAVARLAGIDRIRSVGEGEAHVPERARGRQQFRLFHSFTLFKRSAFAMTDTELKLIAAAAIIGLSRMPNAGYSAPPATGTPTAL